MEKYTEVTKYKEVTICENPKTVIKINDHYLYYSSLKTEELLKDIESNRQDLKEAIKLFFGSIVAGSLSESFLVLFLATGIYGHHLICTIFSSYMALLGLFVFAGNLIFGVPTLLYEARERHFYKKAKKKIEKLRKKGLLKEYIIEPKKPLVEEKKEKDIEESIKEETHKKELSIRETITKLEKEKYDLLHRAEHPTKVIEYDVMRHTKGGEIKRIKLTTVHSPKYEAYKKFVILNGGDKRLFNLPAVNNVIDYIVKYGNSKNPIFYKMPNDDGTFDICGRMGNFSTTIVYKMEYCNDKNPEHFIVFKKYEQKSHFEGDFNYIYECFYNKIYINKEGIIVEETDEIKLAGFEEYDLISDLKEKKLIKAKKKKKFDIIRKRSI